jgi:hypothetical protein
MTTRSKYSFPHVYPPGSWTAYKIHVLLFLAHLRCPQGANRLLFLPPRKPRPLNPKLQNPDLNDSPDHYPLALPKPQTLKFKLSSSRGLKWTNKRDRPISLSRREGKKWPPLRGGWVVKQVTCPPAIAMSGITCPITGPSTQVTQSGCIDCY